MKEFKKPIPVSDVDMAFGGDVEKLMPKFYDIPEQFRNHSGTKWNRLQSDWFYSGINAAGLKTKPGVDKVEAIRHIRAIQVSFAPKHEHKEAAVAYLASLWFEEDSTWEVLKRG